MDAQAQALVALGRELRSLGYRFIAVTPSTHRIVLDRPPTETSLQSIFGWNRPFERADLPDLIFALLVEAGELESWKDRYKSKVRLATIDDLLFVHSAFPTDTPDAVFFGPDTYRFVRLVRGSLGELTEPRPRRIVDIGCGSGAGGLCAVMLLGRGGDVVLADINRKALSYAAVNAAINEVGHVEIAHSDILDGIEGPIDVVLANPPYLVDEGERLYRHGGGKLGLSIALRIVEQGLARLDPGGRLIVYTGTPIIHGVDPFFDSVRPLLQLHARQFVYEEIDPDVFGEELRLPAYLQADRIAAVGLTVISKDSSVTPHQRVWTETSDHLYGPAFDRFHTDLAKYNSRQLKPGFPSEAWRDDVDEYAQVMLAEGDYIEAVRKEIAPLAAGIPSGVDEFIDWFEELKHSGPGQGDPLFPWLADSASREEMLWFLTQEVAGEAGFDDLLAITQIKMPVTAKLEMARNYWDEMGRGRGAGMHGPLLERLADYLSIDARPDRVIPEALALGNAMLALARNRRYGFQSIGALGVIEMTAPTRAGFVDAGLKRLGIPTKKRIYFTLHAVLDIKHSECWNREVLRSLVGENPRCAAAIGEGAIIRLWHGARCFDRYRRHFGLTLDRNQAA